MDTKKTAIAILIILTLVIGGYFVWKNYLSPSSDVPVTTPETQISPEDARDNQRIMDMDNLREAIESYMANNSGQFPVADEQEKISNEESNIFKTLKAGRYLTQPIKDPAPDKYYYGYRSDGQSYELTAVLENKLSDKCEITNSNLCLYKIHGTFEYFYNDEDYSDEYMKE